jgi:hypothetical protein
MAQLARDGPASLVAYSQCSELAEGIASDITDHGLNSSLGCRLVLCALSVASAFRKLEVGLEVEAISCM